MAFVCINIFYVMCSLRGPLEKLPDFAKVTFEECNFVGGGCWWHNLPSTTVQWELASGVAPSMMGPKHDHTTSLYDKSGNYVYMRTSNQKAGEKAILESALFDPPYFNDGSCKVRFHYHMYGKHVFRLQLEVRKVCDPDIKTMKLIWSRTRRVKRNEWIFEAIPLVNITEKFVLRFTGFVGYLTSKGDIALDDITLSPECFKPETVNITDTKVVDPICHKGNFLLSYLKILPNMKFIFW
ncbi:hypothetical protein LOTGIDRAFT_155177 [Lottia gigantea]|uniref:MAM domain-containing protein n=1 Tax=Lottia gigantea TaxID=225164 RepID=V3ZXI2_LOTGI|nr:hypothetical protein LOTGIDRAFT_155177 [Lottia gigantea]ESO85686.1 hypothetical protein LOTGIDRAFT_155177 [Lottia gigantea]